MDGHYDEEDEEITVTLSYKNVNDLFSATKTMQRDSRNVFTLSKQQEDGTKVTVAVCWESTAQLEGN